MAAKRRKEELRAMFALAPQVKTCAYSRPVLLAILLSGVVTCFYALPSTL